MIDKLEKKIGRFAIKNLIYYVLGGYIIGYILYLFDNSLHLYEYITLEPYYVMHGQIWRLFTWVLTIPQALSIWIIFMFLLYFFIGRTLEANLGTFKYNLYMFSGWLFTTLGSMIVYWVSSAFGSGISISASTYYINMASFLAFAVLFPNERVYFFGILPIKIKIIAIIDIVYLGIQLMSSFLIIIMGSMNSSILNEVAASYGYSKTYLMLYCYTTMFSIIFSMLNFVIFFLMTRKGNFKNRQRANEFRRSSEAGRREFNARMNQGSAGAAFTGRTKAQENTYRPRSDGGVVHRCETCGRTSIEHPELQFRYCSKCSGNHEYCQDHIFTHEHIQ